MSDQSSPYGDRDRATANYGENGYEVLLVDEPAEGVRPKCA